MTLWGATGYVNYYLVKLPFSRTCLPTMMPVYSSTATPTMSAKSIFYFPCLRVIHGFVNPTLPCTPLPRPTAVFSLRRSQCQSCQLETRGAQTVDWRNGSLLGFLKLLRRLLDVGMSYINTTCAISFELQTRPCM